MTRKIQYTITLPDELAGMRLDQAIARLLPEYSRSLIQEWIKTSTLKLNDTATKTRTIVLGGEIVTIDAMPKIQPAYEPQDIALDIIFEDEAILIINKAAGMVVHPAAGNPNSTLLNALLHHCPELNQLPRAGIIHRLDKDTTGLLIIAKTPQSLKFLTAKLKARAISRIYQAIVAGSIISGGVVDAPIDRHPIHRKRMAVIETGKMAITHYRVMERYRAYTRIRVQLETGRTHQIRVHMAYIHHPLLGDQVYAGRLHLPKGASSELIDQLRKFKRQALHASEIELEHPTTHEKMSWKIPLPEDMKELINVLKKDAETNL